MTENDSQERDPDSEENRDGGRTSARSHARRLGWWLLITFNSILVAVAGTVIGEAVIRALL